MADAPVLGTGLFGGGGSSPSAGTIDDMRSEYDFRDGVRGKYYDVFKRDGTDWTKEDIEKVYKDIAEWENESPNFVPDSMKEFEARNFKRINRWKEMKPKLVKIYQSKLLNLCDDVTDIIEDYPEGLHCMHIYGDDPTKCCLKLKDGTICGKPKADHTFPPSKMTEEDWKHLAYIDEFVEEIQKKICEKYGHSVTDDHCGRPEHRYCLYCRTSTPNQEPNYDDNEG